MFSNVRDEMKLMIGVGYAGLCVVMGLNACSDLNASDAKRKAEADAVQTPAFLQASTEKELKAKGFTDARYERHERKGTHSSVVYTAKRDGVTYLLEAWCDSTKCDASTSKALRSEPLEAKVGELWKQNGYEVVSYGRFTISYDQKDSTMETVVSKDGKNYNGVTKCVEDKCRVTQMAVTF